MTTRFRLIGVLFVMTLLLAGCLGGDSTTETVDPSETIETDSIPSAEELRSDTLVAMANVSGYTAEQEMTTVRQTAEGNRTVTADTEYALNRSTRSLQSQQTKIDAGIQISADTYVVDETLYQRSEQFRDTYGSEWTKVDISESFVRQWHIFDQLWRYEYMLGNASLSDVETDVVAGSEVYVVDAALKTEEFNRATLDALDQSPGASAAFDSNVSVQTTFWIDPETNRPIKIQRSIDGSQTDLESSVPFNREITTRLTYANTSISLPDGASEEAVQAEN